METVGYLLHGFGTVLRPENVFYCFLGVLLGTLVGVLPGIGPTAGIAMLLPATTVLDPVPAIIMLAGIYYGAMYGGSTTAIVVNIPGEAASVPTAVDGYQMAKQGRAGPALAMAAISSFVAGTLSVIGLTFFAPSLARFALRFGPPEVCALMVLALSVVINLSGRSLVRGLISACLGFLVATIGLDPITGVARFSFGSVELMSGIEFISVIVGLFAIAEVLSNVRMAQAAEVFKVKLAGLMPSWAEIRACMGTMLRATGIGFFLGLIPGCTPAVCSFLSYDIEKRVSKEPEKFGRGAIQGVAGPEGANNATSTAGFIPLFCFGIPSAPALAVLLGGLMMYGLQPGPTLLEKHPQFVWAVVASMYIGNVMLLVLNLPLVPLWARVVTIPYPILAPLIVVFCFVGAFSVRMKLFDVWVAVVFGLIGWFMRKLDFPSMPLILALILGGTFEQALKQSLSMSHTGLLILLQRPIAAAFLGLAAVSVALSVYSRWRLRERAATFLGEEAD